MVTLEKLMSTSMPHTLMQSGWMAGWRLGDLHRARAIEGQILR